MNNVKPIPVNLPNGFKPASESGAGQGGRLDDLGTLRRIVKESLEGAGLNYVGMGFGEGQRPGLLEADIGFRTEDWKRVEVRIWIDDPLPEEFKPPKETT